MTDWKLEISRIVHWKQVIADDDRIKAYPWHLPTPGATSEQIRSAEHAAGIVFSSQYKDFLRHANGWKGFVIAVDLFGTDDFIHGRFRAVLRREELLAFIEEQGLSDGEFVVFGASDADLDVFLLFSQNSRTLPGGILWFATEEVDRYETFIDFFASMTEYNARIARRVSGEPSPPGL